MLATGGRQMSIFDDTAARTHPANAARFRGIGSERDGFARYALVDVITIRYGNDIVGYTDRGNEFTLNISGCGQAGLSIARREGTAVLKELGRRSFGTTGQIEAFRNLAANRVIEVHRHGYSSQNSDDRYDDHQFN